MNMLIATLHEARTNPYSWAIVGLIAAVALINFYKWRYCPYLSRTRTFTEAEAKIEIDRPFVAGPRFIVVMLAGIGAILGGLAMVHREVNPPLALLLIVAGVFAVQTEPALLRLQESAKRVIVAQVEGPEAIAAAEARLRVHHVWLVSISFLILISVVVLLLAF